MDRVCDRWQETALDGRRLVGDYATVEDAIVDFGGFRGIREHLRAESLVPSDDVSPEFGATIQPDRKEGRVYDIWEDGVVVQSVSLDHLSGCWGIGATAGAHGPISCGTSA